MDSRCQPADVQDYLATWDAYGQREMWSRVAEGGNAHVAPQAVERLPAVGPVDALAANAAAVELLIGRRWYVMREAREQGATWEAIGAALGITKQGVQDCYRRKIAQQEKYVGDLHDSTRARAALGGGGDR